MNESKAASAPQDLHVSRLSERQLHWLSKSRVALNIHVLTHIYGSSALPNK
jgi:hypothetical protein